MADITFFVLESFRDRSVASRSLEPTGAVAEFFISLTLDFNSEDSLALCSLSTLFWYQDGIKTTTHKTAMTNIISPPSAAL
jgi:hypothetical protein